MPRRKLQAMPGKQRGVAFPARRPRLPARPLLSLSSDAAATVVPCARIDRAGEKRRSFLTNIIRACKKQALSASAVLALGVGMASAAHADLIFLGPSDLSGQGIGGVSTILSLTSPAHSSTETASVGRTADGTADVIMGDAAAQGNNQTRTLAELGVTQASDLRIILNLNEQGVDPFITLTDLTLNAYNGGSLVFSGSYMGPDLDLTVAGQGIGNSGYMFGLNADQAAALQSVLTADTRIGLSSSLINAEGGFETLSAGNARSVPTTAIPEPGTMALAASSLLPLVGAVIRRRRRSA